MVCSLFHSFITGRFKTKQAVEKHRMSGGAQSITALTLHSMQKKRQRQGTVKSLTLDSNLRLLWAGCPRSQPSVHSSWQIQPRCSWHSLAWSQRIPSHPQSAKERQAEPVWGQTEVHTYTGKHKLSYLSTATCKRVQNLQNFEGKRGRETF